LRLSGARVSASSSASGVPRVAPDTCVGGPLALVEAGGLIAPDSGARALYLPTSGRGIARPAAASTAPAPRFGRGWGALHAMHIPQADQGCDLDVLRDGPRVPEPEIH